MSNTQTLDHLLQHFTDHGLPGCALQITRHHETIYEGYAGMADLENQIPVTSDSLFRQASMSKLPLYTTMMMLYERGAFLFTDPVYDFFPEWKHVTKLRRLPNGSTECVPLERPITVGDTLTMRCGLPYCNFDGPTRDETLRAMQQCMRPLWEKGHFTNREQIRAVASAPLAFEPGTHFLYGFSSELAAGIIEAVCGKSIDDVFQELLFDPLEMNHTRSHFFRDCQERMVKLYTRAKDGTLSRTDSPLDEKHLPGPEHECGWARLFSNVNDFSKLMQMLACKGQYRGRQFLSPGTIDLMRTNVLPPEQLADFTDPYNAGYGYGCGVRTLIDKAAGGHNGSLGAFGWTGGYGTWCEADPAQEVSIVYMHNMIPNEEQYYHLRVRAAAYGILKA